MAFWKRKESRAEQPQETTPAVDDVLLCSLLGGQEVSREMALNIPTLAGCIEYISNTVSMLPIKLYEETASGDEKTRQVREITDDLRVILLNDETGDTLDAVQYWRAIVADYFLGKGGYAYIGRQGNAFNAVRYVDEAVGYSFNNLKIAVGNALIPIAKAVIPSINAIITVLTKMANIFAQVTASIFGKQAAKQDAIAASAQDAAAGQDKLAESTKEAGKAAKASLAGFDKLNVLSKDTGADTTDTEEGRLGSVVGDTGTGGELFGEVIVFPAVQSAVDKIREIFTALKTWYDTNLAPVFQAIGEKIAPHITELQTKISAAWSGIKSLGSPITDWFKQDNSAFFCKSYLSLKR